MSFQQYMSLPAEVVKKLPFLGQAVYYLYKNSGGKTLRGILYEITEVNMNKAWKRLTGDTGEIVQGDKVFVLPNCRIPMFKLTDYLKTTGAQQTADVTEATKIIGHARCKEDVLRQALGSTILMSVSNTHFVSGYKNTYWGREDYWDKARNAFQAAVSSYEDAFEGTYDIEKTIVSGAVWGEGANFSPVTMNFVTPTGTWILYNHILNKILVINEDVVYEKIGKPIIIDKESYQTINDMLSSQDGESQKMGAEILANCDIQPSLYYVWKLSRQHQYTVSNLSKFKNIRLFLRMAKWYDLHMKDPEEFIEYLYDKKQLTREYFSELVVKAARKYDKVLESSVFSLSLVPSERFKEFADGQKFCYSKEPENTEVELVEEEEETDE